MWLRVTRHTRRILSMVRDVTRQMENQTGNGKLKPETGIV